MTMSAHDLMPMFTARNALDGALVDYKDIWQRKNLVLVAVPKSDQTGSAYMNSLIAAAPTIDSDDTKFIVTMEPIAAVPPPGVVVADRWGEIHFVKNTDRVADLPATNELIEWLRYVQNQCPECQGEAR